MRKNLFLAIFVSLTLIQFGCANKKSLVGKWKMTYLTQTLPFNKDTFHLDLSDSSVTNKILRDRLPQSEWDNPSIFGHHSYLQLNEDSTLEMYDMGVFTLHIGNYLGSAYNGTWGIEKDNTLRLQFVKSGQKVAPSYFIIQKLSPDSLIILSKTAAGGAFDFYHQVKMIRE